MTDTNQTLKRLRRLASFSLRTTLIVITVLAVSLGLHMKSVRQQRAAIQAAQSLGCTVYYDYEATDRLLRTRNAESSVPIWLLDTFGRDHFHSVVFVEMGTEREANYEEVLRQLQEFPNLEKLSILGPQLTDSDLKHIGEFTSLRVLIIPSGQHFTGRGLAHLAKLKRLERLILSRCQMAGESLRILSELPKLEARPSHQNVSQTIAFQGNPCSIRLVFASPSNWNAKCPASAG